MSLAGETEGARDALREAIQLDPALEPAYIEWARLEQQLGNLSRAREIYRQATKAIPASGVIWYQWGLLEQQLKQWQTAAGLFQKAHLLKPADVRPLRAMASVLARLRDWRRAEHALRTALTLPVDDAERGRICFELLKILIHTDQPYEKVKEAFSEAYRCGFRAHEMFHGYYQYLTKQKRPAEALEVSELATQDGVPVQSRLPEVFVGGLPSRLPHQVIRRELEGLLRSAGVTFTRITLVPHRGYCFVRLASDVDANLAVEKLKGHHLLGKLITVQRRR